MKLAEIAQRLQCELRGDGEKEILRVVGIEEAGSGDLTFLSNPKYLPKLKTTRASAIILPKDAPEVPVSTLRSDNPYLTFAKSIELFYCPPQPGRGIHATAIIAASARIGMNPCVGPYVVIDEDVTIGDNCTLYPHVVVSKGVTIGDNFIAYSNVSVREHCEIGSNVILQDGVVIGADGFGFAKKDDGSYYKITQSGKVVLEDDVEVQANSTIDRAAIGETRIRKGAKIDNLVQVGHGSKVGVNTLLCAQVGLAGSTDVGDNVILTGQVGVAGHCRIGDGVIATAQSGIPSDVEAGKLVSGYPAIDNKLWLKSSILFSKLPEISKKLREIEQKVEKLTSSH
jgi:UDP-3-O-[3-hydroxymyristoyl] glucosamine N-acyltransferase